MTFEQVSVSFPSFIDVFVVQQGCCDAVDEQREVPCADSPPAASQGNGGSREASEPPEDAAAAAADDLLLGETAASSCADEKDQPERDVSPFSQCSSDSSGDLKPISKIRKTDKSIGECLLFLVPIERLEHNTWEWQL